MATMAMAMDGTFWHAMATNGFGHTTFCSRLHYIIFDQTVFTFGILNNILFYETALIAIERAVDACFAPGLHWGFAL